MCVLNGDLKKDEEARRRTNGQCFAIFKCNYVHGDAKMLQISFKPEVSLLSMFAEVPTSPHKAKKNEKLLRERTGEQQRKNEQT